MRRGTLFGALMGALVAVPAVPAAAQDTTPSWNCRASVLQVFGPTVDPRLEPLVANGLGSGATTDRPQCANDDAGLPAIDQDGLRLRTVAAATRLAPATGAARDQAASAGATVADAAIATPGGELTITARAVQAGATARCVNGVPTFDGASTVADLAVNGQKLPVDDTLLSEITQQINGSPLGGLIKVMVNHKIQTADSLTVQAVRIELFSAAGGAQGHVILGEAKVSKQGDTCAPAGTTPTTPTNGTDGTNGSNGTSGTNGTNGTNGSNTTGSSGAPRPVNEVVINGSNGGCGKLKVWWEKVDLLHRLPGRPLKATSRFGQRAMMRGQLRSCRTGKPIVGAILDHYHHVGKGVGKLTKTGIKTRSAGKFTYIQPLNLTTRRIRIVYRGNLNAQKATAAKTLRLVVRGKRGQIIRGKPPRTLE